MKTLIDFDNAPVFAIPLLDTCGRHGVHEGMLVEGPQGWGEFSPDPDADDGALVRWLTAAMEPGTVGWPDAVRGRIPVAVPVPVVDVERARRIVLGAGCQTADVTLGGSLDDDIARVVAVRDAIGPTAAIRCNANGRWDVDTAFAAITALDRAAAGLEYVVQPCATLVELAVVRRKVDVRIAVDQSLCDPRDPRTVAVTEAADVAVLSCGPLGGVRRALRVAEVCGLPCVVSSELETSVGLAGGLALAGVLPDLPFACGLGTRLLLNCDIVNDSRSLVPRDGYLPVAPMPPAPDPGLIARCAQSDPNRVTWWRERLRAVSSSI